jgi:predicted ester cyclase
MVPENEDVVRRFIEELWNGGELSVAEVLIASAHVHHLGDTDYHGPEGVKGLVVWLRTAFPDLRFAIDDVVSDGDRVVLRWTASGTHLGSGFEVPPTGRRVEWIGTDWFRIVSGQICEVWAIADSGALHDQLRSTGAQD